MGEAGLADAALAIDDDMDALLLDGGDQLAQCIMAPGKAFASDGRLRGAEGIAQGELAARHFGVFGVGFDIVGGAGGKARQAGDARREHVGADHVVAVARQALHAGGRAQFDHA